MSDILLSFAISTAIAAVEYLLAPRVTQSRPRIEDCRYCGRLRGPELSCIGCGAPRSLNEMKETAR